MAIEEPLKSTPKFDAYRDMKKMADDDSLNYFKKWVDIINLEQSANNTNLLSQFSSLSLGDKGAIKDMDLKIVEIDQDEITDNLIITLERLYYSNQKL